MDRNRAPRPWVLTLAALVSVLLAHAPAIEGSFIWDDHEVVIGSRLVTNPAGLREFFETAFFSHQDAEPGGRGYFRPLTVFSWAVDHALHGVNASGYHVTNVLLHVLNTWLLLLLLRRAGASTLAASVGAALWGMMPRLTEAVSWISGRTDALAASFVLGALLLGSRHGTWRSAGASALLLCGLLSKEVALAGFAALLWLWLRRPGASLRARLVSTIPLAVAGAAYAALRLRAVEMPPHGVGLGARRLSAAVEAVGRYAVAILDPWHPNAQNGRLFAANWTYFALGIACLVALALLAVRLRRRERSELEGAGFVLAAVSLGLVLHIVPFVVNVVAADRFLYLPLAGLTLATTRPLATALGRLPSPLRLVGVAVLALSLGACTFRRARLWTDEIDFWTFSYEQDRTNNGTATIELGNIFFRAGLHLHALGVYQSYSDDRGVNYSILGNNMATTLQSLGHYRAARHVLRQVVQRNPEIPKFHVNLALAELSLGNFAAARAELSETLRLMPAHIVARAVLRRIPELEAERSRLEGNDMQQLLLRSRHSVEVARTRDAIDLLVRATEKGTLSPPDARTALQLAGKFADPAAFRAVYLGYVRAMGGAAPAAIEQGYRLRQEASQRLLALWPSLGLSLPKLPE